MAEVYSLPVEKCSDQAICARNLSKKFGELYGVKNLNLDIPAGIIFGYIGPSGSGKTTTIRLLNGTYSPTSGEIHVLGQAPSQFNRQMREKIGYMPQLFSLYPNLSVWENMNFAASLYGMGLFKRNRLMSLLDFVELAGDRDKLARQLSGGMQRRLSLAATLVQQPTLIFLDEPTAGIDPVLRNKFWEHFRSLRDEGRTLFVTTQYVGEVTYCDLVGVMGQGELLMVDTPQGLRYRVYGGEVIDIEMAEPLEWGTRQEIQDLPFVKGKVRDLGQLHFQLVVEEAKTAIVDLITFFQNKNMEVAAVKEYLPPFDEIFVELFKEEERHV